MGSPLVLAGKRLVAFYDVLGIGDRLRQPGGLESVHAGLIALRDAVERHPLFLLDGHERGAYEKGQFLADSLVLVSFDVEDPHEGGANAANFVLACATIMELGFERAYPLRGAIGLGPVLSDQASDILLSPVIKELAQVEGRQDWSGCVVLDDAAGLVERAVLPPAFPDRLGPGGHLVVPYPVPFKDGEHEHLAVNWPIISGRSVLDAGFGFLSGRKADRTKAFVDSMRSQMRELESPPGTFTRIVRCGGTEPLTLPFDASGNHCPTLPLPSNVKIVEVPFRDVPLGPGPFQRITRSD